MQFSSAVTRLLDAEEASERALVLQALGIDSVIVELDGRHVVVVAERDTARARAEIDRYERENPAEPQDRDVAPPIGWGIGAAATYAALAVLFWSRASVTAGLAAAGRIRDGEWWRAVTALTLHADLRHLAGNLLFGSIFGVMLASSVGFGVAWLGFVLTGAIGNGLNAWLQEPTHAAIGASTGVFGMLGMQVAHDGVQRRRARHGRLRRWAPFGVGAALLAWIGGGQPGERIDVWAHLFGFAAGVGFGACLGSRRWRIPQSALFQGVAGALALGLVALAWWFAS